MGLWESLENYRHWVNFKLVQYLFAIQQSLSRGSLEQMLNNPNVFLEPCVQPICVKANSHDDHSASGSQLLENFIFFCLVTRRHIDQFISMSRLISYILLYMSIRIFIHSFIYFIYCTNICLTLLSSLCYWLILLSIMFTVFLCNFVFVCNAM